MLGGERWIIHLDMDCFYAAIEMREQPELAGKPLGVGGTRDRRGVLTTCNYEARKYGVSSAMPTYIALQRCPQLIVVPTRFDVYRAESARVRNIFRQFTDQIEPLSLDEAYLDVTAVPFDPAAVAAEIRDRIQEETGLTASAGIAPNKLLAKIASDWNKPNGQHLIRPEEVPAFMKELPLRKIWGIGAVSAERLARAGARTCGDLQRYSRVELHGMLGSFGLELHELCRGIDHRPVEPHRPRKSLSTERTFDIDLTTLEECERRLMELYEELMRDLKKHPGRSVHKLFLKLKFNDFSRTTIERMGDKPDVGQYHQLLAEAFGRRELAIRLMGIGVRFTPEHGASRQMELPLPT